MSKSFNYRKAWDELAAPAFALLTAAVLELFRDVTAAYGEARQQGNLEMPWLPGFREKFELFSTDTLARAARAIYFYGHWNYKGSGGGHGETWKFANLADQVISARLGLLNPNETGNNAPVSYRVHEGALRLCLSRADYRTWEEIGYASPELLEAVRATNPHAPAWTADGPTPEDVLAAAAKVAPMESAPWDGLLHAGERYTEEQVACAQCGSKDPKYSYGLYFADELCKRGECPKCCTCYLLGADPGELRAEILKVAGDELQGYDTGDLMAAVHKLRKGNGLVTGLLSYVNYKRRA